MFTNSLAIIERIKEDLEGPVASAVPGIALNLDEPLELVYSDLPSLSIYQVREDFLPDESFSEEKKRLAIRIELRMKGGPSSLICTPVINLISDTIKANRTLGGLADYVERQTIQWANDSPSEGQVCGASLDVQVDYLI